ncbi:hypothetical protein KAR91_12845 [Candidatus Pacearchaeota archaeon]|nr:hypothetical protein [Candidatus Pacearchaeota archaeon]
MTKKKAKPAPKEPESLVVDGGHAEIEWPSFVYIGDPKDGHSGPNETKPYGFAFTKNGPPVKVNDMVAATKFEGNPHFANQG